MYDPKYIISTSQLEATMDAVADGDTNAAIAVTNSLEKCREAAKCANCKTRSDGFCRPWPHAKQKASRIARLNAPCF